MAQLSTRSESDGAILEAGTALARRAANSAEGHALLSLIGVRLACRVGARDSQWKFHEVTLCTLFRLSRRFRTSDPDPYQYQVTQQFFQRVR